MNWLFPGFLWGIAAIALPILLHLLRRRPVRYVAFPSLRFLATTQPKNDRSQRLRRWLVLVLRCAVLALLAAAFARPFVGGERPGGSRAVVIVVDGSFSLRASGRWEALRAWTHEQLGEFPTGDRVGVLWSGVRPEWLVPMTGDFDRVRTRLAELKPGWETTRVEPALRLAGQTLAAMAADRREIIFAGDHQRLSWAGFEFGKKLPPGVTAVFSPVASAIKRQAALFTPTLVHTADGWRAMLPVRNFSGAQTRTLRVFRDGALLSVKSDVLALNENEARSITIDLPADTAAAGWFRFELDADDLPADDRVYAVATAGGGARVLLDAPPAGGGTDFVGVALTAAADVEPRLAVERAPASSWPEGAVGVLRNDTSFAGEAGARLATFLRAGGSALVFVDGGLAQAAWLKREAGITLKPLRAGDTPLALRDWAMDHALVTALASHSVNALLDWNFERGWALPPDVVEPLALWPGGGAAIGEANMGTGHLLICGFPADRREGDWAVREGFVPFVHRAAAYLHGARENAKAKPLVVGDTVTLPAESGHWRAVDGPATGEAPLEVRGTVTPREPGVYEFADGATRSFYAVNLAEEESDPAPWSEGTPWTQLTAPSRSLEVAWRPGLAAGADAERQGQLWWWAVAAMAVMVLAEIGLANRTSR